MALLLVTATVSQQAYAAGKVMYKANVRGETAFASWLREDNGVFTSVFVYADSVSNVVYVGIFQYTLEEVCDKYSCWEEQVPIMDFFGSKQLSKDELKIAKNLRSAALNTTVAGYEFISGDEKTITIAVQWDGYGDVQKSRLHYMFRTDTYMVKINTQERFRSADASGSIAGDINMDLGSSDYARLSNVRVGIIEMVKL
ncbi:MAG: hypothetical protein QXW14_03935 [Candidatus Nitrosocaldus sp.]